MEKIKLIKAVITDVDGVLTDGGIYYDTAGQETKKFNAKDGMGVGMLRKAGLKVGLITGRHSETVIRRAEELKFDFHIHGAKDKQLHFQNFKDKFNLKNEEIAYIGDDINDLVVMLQCGIKVCPADAPDYIQVKMDYVTQKKGGDGAFREFSDWILENQGKLETIINDKIAGVKQ